MGDCNWLFFPLRFLLLSLGFRQQSVPINTIGVAVDRSAFSAATRFLFLNHARLRQKNKTQQQHSDLNQATTSKPTHAHNHELQSPGKFVRVSAQSLIALPKRTFACATPRNS